MELFMRILRASMAGAVSIIVLWGLFYVLGRKCGAWYRKMGWLLIALFMLVPVNISIMPKRYLVELPNVVIYEQHSAVAAGNSEISGNGMKDGEEYGTDSSHGTEGIGNGSASMQSSAVKEITTLHIFMGIWATVAVLLAIYYLAGYFRVYHKVVRWSDECKDEDIIQTASEVAEKFKMKKAPEIRMLKGDGSGPFTIGVFRNIIFLPNEGISEKDIQYILRHETVHCKNHDILCKIFLTAVCVVHWFNPFVWLMRRLAEQDMEVACDEAALQGASMEEREEYSNIIMSWIEKSSGQKRENAFSTGYVFGKRFLKRRFTEIFYGEHKKHGVVLLLGSGIILLLAGGVVGVEAGRTLYRPQEMQAMGTTMINEYDYFINRKELYTDIDGDGRTERIWLSDIKYDDYNATRLTTVFENGDRDFIEFPGLYSPWFVAGDLNGDGITDIVLMRVVMTSNYGATKVNLLRYEDGEWIDYTDTLGSIPDLERETMIPFIFAEHSYLGGTIIQGENQHLLRLIVPDDLINAERVICIDLSWQGDKWQVENLQKIDDYYSKEGELLNLFGE